jgi:SAM-dependent methyltransferase
MTTMNTRWQRTYMPRGADYDARWSSLAASGVNIHGEADLVESLLRESGGRNVLDAGCGTGRIAIELARRGFAVTGVDADPGMLAEAVAKDPKLPWLHGDLADPDVVAQIGAVDLVLLAGNVMVFLEPGTEPAVLANLADRLNPGGLLVAGFSLQRDLDLERYDEIAKAARLQPVARWATWDRQPFDDGSYAVSVHGVPR